MVVNATLTRTGVLGRQCHATHTNTTGIRSFSKINWQRCKSGSNSQKRIRVDNVRVDNAFVKADSSPLPPPTHTQTCTEVSQKSAHTHTIKMHKLPLFMFCCLLRCLESRFAVRTDSSRFLGVSRWAPFVSLTTRIKLYGAPVPRGIKLDYAPIRPWYQVLLCFRSSIFLNSPTLSSSPGVPPKGKKRAILLGAPGLCNFLEINLKQFKSASESPECKCNPKKPRLHSCNSFPEQWRV